MMQPTTAARRCPLTPRQHHVVTLLADDLTDAQIGDRLVLAVGTVANHVEHILHRLDLDTRAELAAWARRHDSCPAESEESRRWSGGAGIPLAPGDGPSPAGPGRLASPREIRVSTSASRGGR